MNRRFLHALRLFKLATVKFFADDMPTHSAALAYRLLFSLFPFIIFLTTLLGFIGMPGFFGWMREQANHLLPEQAMDAVDNVIGDLRTPRGGLMSVGIAIAIWVASAGMVGIMNALNVAYDVKERRPVWKRFSVAIVYTVALALMLLIAAALMVSGPEFVVWLARHVGLDALFVEVWTWARWPVAIFLLMLVVALVYYAAPNVKQPFRLITPGSVLAVSTWIVTSIGFGFYVQNFANYNRTYGSMAAVIVLLFYFFLSAAVMLFGAELNAAITRERDDLPEQK